MRTSAACVEFDPQTKLYAGIVPGIPGAHAQASVDDLRENPREVLELCLSESPTNAEEFPRFVSLQQVEVEV